MSEGSYPRRDRDDPLLPDPVKAKLDPVGEVMPDRQRRALLERRTYLVARNSAPAQYLYWPRGEAGARRGSGPARWFLEAARDVERQPVAAARRSAVGQTRQPRGDIAGRDPGPPGHFRPSRPARVQVEIRGRVAMARPGRGGDHFLASDPALPFAEPWCSKTPG